MDSLSMGRKTPGSGRKISHSETVRAIALADTPRALRETTYAAQSAASSLHDGDTDLKAASAFAETPARRRRSRVDRTPAQVKSVLSERKRRSSAGLLKPVKELTPGGLLRALSRMPDLPPPTPEDSVNDPSSATRPSASASRRQSYIPNRSSLLASRSSRSSFGSVVASPENREVSQPVPSSSPGAAVSVADLNASQRSSFSHRRRSSAADTVVALSEANQSRRSSVASIVSVASVEAARRASVLPVDLSRFLTRRRRITEAESEKGEGSVLLDEGVQEHDSRYSLGGQSGRFSMGSELGRDLSFANPDMNSPGKASASGSRLSLASAYGNLSAARLSLPISLDGAGAEEEELRLSDEAKDGVQNLEGDGEQGEYGGGYDEEEVAAFEYDAAGAEQNEHELEGDGDEAAERIPWEEKGKGRAAEGEEDQSEEVWTSAAHGVDYGCVYLSPLLCSSCRTQSLLVSIDSFDEPIALPSPPPLAQVALNRKNRLRGSTVSKTKRKKKQRYTRTGESVPDLPRTRQKSLFQHFLSPGVKLENDAVDALMDASQDFFAVLMQDASAAALRSGRNSTINEDDLLRAFYDQRLLTSKLPISSLARQLGVGRELQSLIDGLGVGELASGKGRKRGSGRKGKEKLEEVEEEVDESMKGDAEDDEDEEDGEGMPPSLPKQKKRAPAQPRSAKAEDPPKKRRRSSTGTAGRRAKRASAAGRKRSTKNETEALLDASSGDEGDVFSE
ncbi:hypothetical protein JCM8547_004894 [Rhodosporidiobolus lusitaniae]